VLQVSAVIITKGKVKARLAGGLKWPKPPQLIPVLYHEATWSTVMCHSHLDECCDSIVALGKTWHFSFFWCMVCKYIINKCSEESQFLEN